MGIIWSVHRIPHFLEDHSHLCKRSEMLIGHFTEAALEVESLRCVDKPTILQNAVAKVWTEKCFRE
jgi:hypothetical protein